MHYLFVTPLEARQDVSNYTFVFLAAAIVIVVIAINSLYKFLRNAEAQKNFTAKRPTTYANINHLAQMYGLSDPEKEFLWSLCKGKKIPNLEYNLRYDSFSENFFGTQYQEIRSQQISDDEVQNQLSLLFSIRQKSENARKNQYNITTTSSIPVGSTISYYTDKRDQYALKIISMTKDDLVLSIPHDVLNNEVRPEPLSKITLLYQTKQNTAYVGTVRVIRYQNATEQGEMVVTHCNNLLRYQRRQFKRIPLNNTCYFSAVQVTTGGKGKETNITYTPLDKKYKGQLLELSAGGCSILTGMNIKQKQYINVRFQIDGFEEDSVIGFIVENTPQSDNRSFVLHIVFVRVSKKARNKIFSTVYEYRT